MKILKKINEIKLNFLKIYTENKTDKIKLKNELKKQEILNFEIEHKHYINNTRLKFMKSTKNTKTLSLFLCLMIIGSTLMTCAGLNCFSMLASSDKLIMGIVLTIILVKIQIITFYGSAIYNYVYKNFNTHSKKLKLIPLILLPVSILGNFNFLKMFVVVFGNKYIDNTITILICIVYDLSIITFMGYRYDKKHLIFSYFNKENLQEDVSIIAMIIFIITNWFRQKIKPKYINSLKKYKNGLTNSLDDLTNNLDQNKNDLTLLNDLTNNLDQNKNVLNDLTNSLDQNKNDLTLLDGSKKSVEQNKNVLDDLTNSLDQNKNNSTLLNNLINSLDQNKNVLDGSKNSLDQNKNNLTLLNGSKKSLNQNKNKREIEEIEKLSYTELLNAIKSLIYAYKENEEVKASSFKNLFSIDTQTWRKIRTQLQKENLIYTKEGTKRSYKSKNINIRNKILAK
jgi:hypothetical protein